MPWLGCSATPVIESFRRRSSSDKPVPLHSAQVFAPGSFLAIDAIIAVSAPHADKNMDSVAAATLINNEPPAFICSVVQVYCICAVAGGVDTSADGGEDTLT